MRARKGRKHSTLGLRFNLPAFFGKMISVEPDN